MARRNSHLPPVPSYFVGRDAEVKQVAERLAHPNCRLLTLVGMGGMGKTRLALQLAVQLADSFENGVRFVPVQGVTKPNLLPAAMADGLGLSLAGQISPIEQIQNHLYDQEILLTLDSFEHLLDAAEMMNAILAAAPGVKLLITSRERLNLQQEWVWPVSGLSIPESSNDEDLEQYGSIQLFVERAQRVRPTFSLDAERTDVVELCRLTEGMPLALELAASWVRNMRCSEIVNRIQADLGFLSTTLRDIPPRQRSVHAVFEQSWQLLSDQEQPVFARLAVFTGGFTIEAAERIARASLPILTALVDKSLLYWEQDGRYQMHQLLWEFAQEQLAHASEEMDEAKARYVRYYTSFLHAQLPAMNGEHQLEACAAIEAELVNVRQAWEWMVASENVEAIRRSEQTLYLFYQFRSRYQEGIATFEEAVQRLDSLPPNQALAQVLVDLGWLYIRIGEMPSAQQALQRSVALYTTSGNPPPSTGMATNPLIPLAVLDLLRGEYGHAAQLGIEVLGQSEECSDEGNQMFAHYVLTSALLAQGKTLEAQKHARHAYDLVQRHQNQWFAAYCLIEMGNVAHSLGQMDEAQRHYQASYTIREQFKDREGMAIALSHLGRLAFAQREYREAVVLLQRSLILYENLGDKGGLARTVDGLGRATTALREYDAARGYLARALKMAQQASLDSLLLSILASVAELYIQIDEVSLATRIMAYVQQHEASSYQVQARIQQIQSQNSDTRQDEYDLPDSIPEVTAAILETLSVFDHQALRTASANQNLADPLTPRELEVLHLLGNGLSNREIAGKLVLALGTVKSHVHRICSKLGVNSRTKAVARARDLHLL